MARFTETVVFPTPPFPEPTANRFLTPVIGSFGCSACAAFGPISSILEHSPIPSRLVREVLARPDREESPLAPIFAPPPLCDPGNRSCSDSALQSRPEDLCVSPVLLASPEMQSTIQPCCTIPPARRYSCCANSSRYRTPAALVPPAF